MFHYLMLGLDVAAVFAFLADVTRWWALASRKSLRKTNRLTVRFNFRRSYHGLAIQTSCLSSGFVPIAGNQNNSATKPR
jgi:hypothetical protein